MSLKSVLGILIAASGALALAGMAVLAVHQQGQLSALRKQNESLQADTQELERLRASNQAAQHFRNQETELQQLRESNKELLRLRNEVRQHRELQQELETLRAANAELLQAAQGLRAGLPNSRMALVTSARRKGSVLGVSILSASDPNSGVPAGDRAGVVVTGLMPNSPATESGLQPGDLILALDGRAVTNAAQLQAEMLTRKAGETVLVDVVRGNEALRLQVKTRAWPESP